MALGRSRLMAFRWLSVERRRGQAIRVVIDLVNWQQEEPTGCGGGRQLSMNGTSRVTGDCHARFCERLGVKFPGPTRRWLAMIVPTATPLFFSCTSRGRASKRARAGISLTVQLSMLRHQSSVLLRPCWRESIWGKHDGVNTTGPSWMTVFCEFCKNHRVCIETLIR